MAKRKVEKILLSPIAKQIDKVREKLNSLRPRVSEADQQTIDLEIEKLVKFREDLAGFCKKMTQPFSLPPKKREKYNARVREDCEARSIAGCVIQQGAQAQG